MARGEAAVKQKKTVKRQLRTPIFRMSYAKLIEPSPYINPETRQPKGDPEFSVEMLFEKDVMDEFAIKTGSNWEENLKITNILGGMVREMWGRDFDIKEAIRYGGLDWPIKDGNKKVALGEEQERDFSHYANTKMIRGKAKEDYEPQLAILERDGKIKSLDRFSDAGRIKSLFVSGHYAIGNCNLVAQQTPQGKYLTFYLNGVIFMKEGKRLGGQSVEDMFAGISGGESNYDPTADMDDDIPY